MEVLALIGLLGTAAAVIVLAANSTAGSGSTSALRSLPIGRIREIHAIIDDEDAISIGNFGYNKSVLISLKNRKIFLFNEDQVYPELSFDDIETVELVINESISEKTDRASQVTGAAVGALLAGSAGAVIGGLSARRMQQTGINSASVDIRTNDPARPRLNISFWNKSDENNRAREIEGIERANRFYDVVSSIIAQNKRNS